MHGRNNHPPPVVLGLRTGCCPDPDPNVGLGHHLIRGNEYKTALDEDGNHLLPPLDRCRPECGNVVRTDRHASQLRERANFLEFRGAQAPGPVSDRLRGNAAKLRAFAEHHDHTSITLQGPTE